MKRFAITSAIAATVAMLSATVASADTITGTGSNGLQAFPGTIDNYNNPNATIKTNRPYWDNQSSDSLTMGVPGPNNIGNLINGTFNTAVTGPISPPTSINLANVKWWGNTGTNANSFDTNVEFNSTDSVGPVTANFLGAAALGANTVGWYDASNPTGTKTQLWAAGVSASSGAATVVFTPTTNWGFYMTTSGGTYYMDAVDNTTDASKQHFTIFQTDATTGDEVYYVGIEDAKYGSSPEGNGDFNDFMLEFSTTGGGSTPGTPEPTSLAILGVGAMGLLIRRRK